jgi:hypothetical protein
MTAPVQAFSHRLDSPKGWPQPYAVDFAAVQSANCLYNLRAGQCVHLNSSMQYEPGVQLGQMAIWLFQGAASLDVDNSVPADNQWVPVTPPGKIMGLVAKSAIELQTTEFVQTLTYNPNDYLRSPTGNSAGSEGLVSNLPTTSSSGVLRNDTITLYTTAVVGVVSSGVSTNYLGYQVLNFWPVYLPGTV